MQLMHEIQSSIGIILASNLYIVEKYNIQRKIGNGNRNKKKVKSEYKNKKQSEEVISC
jgi:hypothetical protein